MTDKCNCNTRHRGALMSVTLNGKELSSHQLGLLREALTRQRYFIQGQMAFIANSTAVPEREKVERLNAESYAVNEELIREVGF